MEALLEGVFVKTHFRIGNQNGQVYRRPCCKNCSEWTEKQKRGRPAKAKKPCSGNNC